MGIPFKKDSAYPDKIERPTRTFNPLRVPTALQKTLPFASKPKNESKRASNKPLLEQRRPLVLEPEEKKRIRDMQQIQTIRHDKDAKRQESQARRQSVFFFLFPLPFFLFMLL
jgi:ribosome biogenesis protein BMS1